MHLAVHPLVKLIAEGEGLSLDFKKTISSAKKIARTLVAFANTRGGSLLVGVRDNGSIAGIRAEEEMYMIDSAAKVFCQPAVRFEYKLHEYRGLAVLQVIVPQSLNKPHLAKTDEGDWRIYLRVNDKSVLASPIVEEILRRQTEGTDTRIRYTDVQRTALAYLADHPDSRLPEVARALLMAPNEATEVLVELGCAGLVEVVSNERDERFRLADLEA